MVRSNILFITYCTLSFVCIHFGNARPITRSISNEKMYTFLTNYGYMTPTKNHTKDAMADAIKMMQSFYGMAETGEMDDETTEMMLKPRCGMKDVQIVNNKPLAYTAFGTPWLKKRLTFYVKNRVQALRQNQIARDVKQAFDMWGTHSGLKFFEVKSGKAKSDIVISFAYGDHEDGDAFDGPGGTLAHAEAPNNEGVASEIHFDAAEDWSEYIRYGYEHFYEVALHEIGHVLGLGHSKVKNAVMYPYSNGILVLQKDDIKGIKKIYKRS